MSREIKFRAFVHGEMFYPTGTEREGYTGLPSRELYHKFYDNELMQFTGLKDKNGKEIYEGDIFSLGDLNILYVCDFDNGYFGGMQHGNKSRVGLAYWESNIEVIGNIYENPELLKINS